MMEFNKNNKTKRKNNPIIINLNLLNCIHRFKSYNKMKIMKMKTKYRKKKKKVLVLIMNRFQKTKIF